MAYSKFAHLFIWGLIFCVESFAQGPPLTSGTCLAYRRLALGSLPIKPISSVDPLKPGFVPTPTQVIISGGGDKLELPGKTNWTPKCEKDGSYTQLQTRQNKSQFCVLPKTGAIVLEVPQSASSAKVTTPYFCGCAVQFKIVISERLLSEILPDCNVTTGFYKPLQVIPRTSPNSSVCVFPNGTRSSEPFAGGAGSCDPSGKFVPAKNGIKPV